MVVNDLGKPFVFVHIPKTAGCAIRHTLGDHIVALREQNPGWNKLPRKRYNKHASILSVPQPKKYFKFAIVRNPWDRMFSFYNFIKTRKNDNIYWSGEKYRKMEFKTFLLDDTCELRGTKKVERYTVQTTPQLDWVTNNKNKIAVDFVGKLETIQEDFNYICEQIEAKPVELIKKNVTEHDDYRTVYDNEMIDFIAEYHKSDIDKFGYSFE